MRTSDIYLFGPPILLGLIGWLMYLLWGRPLAGRTDAKKPAEPGE